MNMLVRYDAACRAVAEAKSVDEVKELRDKAEAMRAYARQAKNKTLEIDAAEIRIRAERRIGAIMAAQREAGGLADGGDAMRARVAGKPEVATRLTLAEVGIDKNLADRARKLAAVPQEAFDAKLDSWRGRVAEENERGTFGTGENEWYTPDEHIALARNALGEIDLDPASSEVAQRVVQAGQFFTLADDGLSQEWAGRVFLNPPYAQPAIADFADKMVAEWKSGRIEAAIMLTHNYTDTAWFHAVASAATAICFTRGRVRFVSPDGDLAAPTQGQAFFYFGDDLPTFASVFSPIGFVVEVRA
jgi:phage N-6-adenine-methyltransferase